jgi:hypothetical protein
MADSGIGDKSDSKATDSTSNWTVISLLKAIVGNTGTGGTDTAVTVVDGGDVTEGAIADAAVSAGATGSVSAKLRSISRDVGALTETAPATDTASSGINGRLQRIAQRLTTLLAVFPTTIDTNSGAKSASTLRTVHATDDTMIGALTETAPANDTASSGLNGRLQRIAQNITTLISSSLIAVGNVASAATDSGNPVKTGGKYNSTKPTLTNGQRGDTQVEINGATTVALYGKSTNPGDTPVKVSSAGVVSNTTAVTFNDAASGTFNNPDDGSGNARLMGVGGFLYDNTAWTRQRGVTPNTVLASAARTGTVSTDVTNHNGKTIAVTLNITVAPNTASTLTLQIRLKDSISGNYTTLLASAAIVGTATTGVVPVTNLYRIGQGITVTTNVSAADVLGRTMNVNIVHSNADSWTYSVSADIGL